MKTGVAALGLLLSSATAASAFTPSAFTRQTQTLSPRSKTRVAAVDPSFLSDLPSHVDGLHNAFSSLMVSDEAISGLVNSVADASDIAEAAATSDAVMEVAVNDNGWFGFLTMPITGLLTGIHGALVAVGMDANAWGVSIVAMTLIIKLATLPLTKSQLESTTKMQTLQPAIKEVQAKYQSNPEVMNQKIAEIYQTNEVNPLAGCIPSIVQIPVFIGLYRAVLNLAKADALDEPFLWLPNLEGPTYGADPTTGSDWLFKNWVDGTPSLGWDNTVAFLAIPVILVISQFVSMQLMQPKSEDPQQQQANAILKFLPLMIGYFSLSVPAALGIYWVTNNFVTTAITLSVRNSLKNAPPPVVTASPSGSGPTVIDAESTVFTPAPMRSKPSGFGESDSASEGMKPITTMDAEIVSEGDDEPIAGSSIPAAPQSKKRGGKKKKKRRN